MAHCSGGETCSTADNSKCPADKCASGYYNDNGACVACGVVDHCLGGETCSTSRDSVCPADKCAAGYYNDDGACATCS